MRNKYIDLRIFIINNLLKKIENRKTKRERERVELNEK
jgi:hypothetical protein